MNVFHKFALQSLKQNRTRTIVTIIGIILSVSMLTAVTTTISSIQQYLLDVTIQESGSWHAMFSGISKKQAKDIEKREGVDESGVLKNVCYVITCLKQKMIFVFHQSSLEILIWI